MVHISHKEKGRKEGTGVEGGRSRRHVKRQTETRVEEGNKRKRIQQRVNTGREEKKTNTSPKRLRKKIEA